MSKAKGKTLAQILAEELKEWPKGVDVVTQSQVDGELYNDQGETSTSLVPAIFLTMHQEKVEYPQVTRAQWEAERAKLNKPKANKDGWIRHRGGKCPVGEDTTVEYRMRDGLIMCKTARHVVWGHYGETGDVMAYRILQQDQQSSEKAPDSEMPATTPIDGPLQWRDRITEIDRTVEALEKERVSLVQRLADEGLQLKTYTTIGDALNDLEKAGLAEAVQYVRSRMNDSLDGFVTRLASDEFIGLINP